MRGCIAIACGGTGGHLFPGAAVGERLVARGWDVLLLVSPKEIDRRGTEQAFGMQTMVLPAVGLERGRLWNFLQGCWRSYWMARRWFDEKRPAAVLAMGGFTSAPPVLAGRHKGMPAFLHEANGVPGRANRWLARWVDRAFVGFPQAAARFRRCRVEVTGTPVRMRFRPQDQKECRITLGLEPDAPVLLVLGGSQGATAVNGLVLEALPLLQRQVPVLQILHVTGSLDFERVRRGYEGWSGRALVREFVAEMEAAMGAATVALGRAGGSVLAELAAMGLPSILVPYPSAVENHQLSNARALVDTGAARLLEQVMATPVALAVTVRELVGDEPVRRRMTEALRRWHRADAADRIADVILERVEGRQAGRERKVTLRDAAQVENGGLRESGRKAGALAVMARGVEGDGRR
jgi:UDP-N-acetylglucosamine--N-acetylmuramyl-(pentapeptide) pyrophosphoryl-undecaprenol N-acetylglucosamine transferase